ncbi:25S rRNA (cytosine2278-C5)-methyltransferase [Geosmithia morbida]|uniref:25S rRNA (Cytosine2278-C5)-methyltransferase n=1 Tax=Geosmithia morbida TaxID=1094350 RepID=A0A9P4YLK6_9HYPO|nr:25S rRNA (cytosine2278-C5)-methyltransferase [Geosmithia morbida]KAF4119228.1 25S rRNA (cytosine2278-C5)-methyltransferase [Geosmithia morbida]
MSLYHEAAELLQASPSEGGSLKARVFGKKDLKSPPGQLYALVLETCKWSSVLKEVVDRAGILKLERKLTPALSILLAHDLLLAKGGVALPQSHGLRQSIERHKGRLSSELTLARIRRKLPTTEALREQVEKAAVGDGAGYPRWVRVNALKSSVEEQLETTFSRYDRAADLDQVTASTKATGKAVYIDPHVPGLLAVTQGTDLSRTEAYTSGKIILQDKASCFPAYLLDPQPEDGDVIDACAAPGNKTTHLAAILRQHQPEFESPAQTIYAFEKDARRAKTLDRMVRIAGSRETTRIGPGQDFLQVDPRDGRYEGVGALLLDPSCSGSGIVGRDSMPELHLPGTANATADGDDDGKGGRGSARNPRKRERDQAGGKEEEAEKKVMVDDDGNETVVQSDKDLKARLRALSGFQLTLLLHAFLFPGARKVTYSTCSVHAEENEHVVMAALTSEAARARGWRILTRPAQVAGMRDWPVRGLPEECGGDRDVSEGCIRSYKGDGRGVMGFFVAGFVRDGRSGDGHGHGQQKQPEEEESPYVQNDDGSIVRDVTEPREGAVSSGHDIDVSSGDASDDEEDGEDGEDEEDGEDGEDEDEWGGIDD